MAFAGSSEVEPWQNHDRAMDLIFSDLQNDWAQACIVQLAEDSIVSGYADNRFRPEAPLTRAEFAALIVKAFPEAEAVRIPVEFPDVPPTHWAQSAIETATEKGFFTGYPDGTFQPDRLIPRVQAISVLASTQDHLTDAPTAVLSQSLDDAATIPNWAKSAIAQATAGFLTVNYPDGRQLQPDRNITRSEVAALLCRTLNIDAIDPEYIAGFPKPPTQARPVLNQTPDTIARYFGLPLSVSEGQQRDFYTYVSAGIWKLFPDFHSGGEFSVTFIDDRATSIGLSPTTNPSDPFVVDRPKVEALFQHVFGYKPARWEFYPGWNSGGHEGFASYKVCLGDGIATTFDYIGTLGGSFGVGFYYDRVCE